MQPAEFIASIASAAQDCMSESKVPASVSIAQAILESSWGASQLAVQGFNLFGIKADASWGDAPTITLPTWEYSGNVRYRIEAAFRKYPSWLGSMRDHAAFLIRNKRYAPAFETTSAEAFAQAIAAAGYATDPHYASSVIALMRIHNLEQYDQVKA